MLLGNGDGTFTQAAVGPVSVGDFPQSTVAIDFTGSGISDLPVGNENDNVSMLLSTLETATATVNGVAPVGAGMHNVEASYSGDSNYGDGGAALLADLNEAAASALDSAGNLYIADVYNNVIRRVAASGGAISTVAGNGQWGYSGDGGPATASQLRNPWGSRRR